MKQKIILSLLASTVVLSVPAVSQADSGTIQAGFFVGLAADAVISNYGYRPIAADDIKKSSNSVLFRPDIYLGYGELVSSNNLYIGFDAGFQIGSKTTEVGYYNASPLVSRSASEGFVYYADILPGFVFGNQSSIFYGIVGATHGSFKLQQTGAHAFSQTDGQFGYRIGAGYNYALTDSFSVGFKYVFSGFGSIKYKNGAEPTYELNPKNNEFSLGVNYTFGGSSAGTQGPFLGN